jgi:hypothetical protein
MRRIGIGVRAGGTARSRSLSRLARSSLGRGAPDVPITCANGQLVDSIAPNGVAEAGSLRHVNRALRRDLNFGLDDIFVPISLARGNISRKRETRERGHRDVVRPPNTSLQHSATPDRNGVLAADLLDPPRFAVAADPPELNINDPAGFQFDGRESVPRIINAFIQTDRGLDLRLQLRMRVDVVPVQRLFHHQQLMLI